MWQEPSLMVPYQTTCGNWNFSHTMIIKSAIIFFSFTPQTSFYPVLSKPLEIMTWCRWDALQDRFSNMAIAALVYRICFDG